MVVNNILGCRRRGIAGGSGLHPRLTAAGSGQGGIRLRLEDLGTMPGARGPGLEELGAGS